MHPIGARWGTTDAEIAAHYPCDDVVPHPGLQLWRAVTVQARPEDVWPWIAQIRLAPYSYDWIDNLGHSSPQRLQHLAEPRVGENFSAVAGRPQGRILSVTPGEQLTGRILGAVLSYVLAPHDSHGSQGSQGQATRLLMKVVAARGRRVAPLIGSGELVMARRQLLNLKRLAERA